MGGQGFAPQERRARPRDERKRQAEMRPITADGVMRGEELPEGVLPDGDSWHPRTLAWWETWRTSAQAQILTPTDWDFLLDTALLHHVMWTRGKWEFASEVRLRAAKFGATPEDRMRLKLRVDTPDLEDQAPAGGGAKVTEISSRRARLAE